MGFTVNLLPSQDRFKAVCTELTQLGKVGFERICISTGEDGFRPCLTSTPGWIERILRFFRFKNKNVRLQEVANFSLNWLRAHAFHYTKEFHAQISQLETLRPLMKKAQLEKEFDRLLDETKEKAPQEKRVQKFVEDSKELITESQKRFDELAKQLQDAHHQNMLKLEDRLYQLEEIRVQLTSRIGRMPIVANFKLHWPKEFKEKDQAEPLIKTIISDFLLHPGTIIRRQKKSTTISLDVPEQETRTYDLPVKIDFYLEGAIRQRQIIMKTQQIIGTGGQRKVLQAYDLLSGRELVSKPFVSDGERLLVRTFHQQRIAGVVPYFAGTEKRFYEMKCQPLIKYLKEPIEVRAKMALELISGLNNIHDIILGDCVVTCPNGHRVEIPRLPFYHGDIKFPNILVFENQLGKLEAAFSDLGGAAAVEKYCYSSFFRSPELTRFIENTCYFLGQQSTFLNQGQIIQHNLAFGQSNDVWSLGLVLLTLLAGKTLNGFSPELDELGVPDLSCFINRLKQVRFSIIRTDDEWIQRLTQKEIDESIDKLKKECSLSDAAKKIWSCIPKMLQVDPQNRATIQQVFLTLNP